MGIQISGQICIKDHSFFNYVPGGEEFDELSDGESREGGDERVVRENGEIMMSRRRRRGRRILHGD